jgi:hypothetical protein
MAKSKKVGVARASSGPSKKTSRPYPNKTLEEALKIPQAIRDKNNGNPWAVEDVAQAAYGLKPTNNRFFYLAAAARDYGLTIGTRYTERIELAPLGREIVFAGDEGTKQQKLIESFFSVDVFKRVYEHYGSANLPEKEFLSNTLQSEFGLASEFLDEFTDIFKANCKFLGIDQGVRPGLTVPT